jgi:hypothetical protein
MRYDIELPADLTPEEIEEVKMQFDSLTSSAIFRPLMPNAPPSMPAEEEAKEQIARYWQESTSTDINRFFEDEEQSHAT